VFYVLARLLLNGLHGGLSKVQGNHGQSDCRIADPHTTPLEAIHGDAADVTLPGSGDRVDHEPADI